MSDECGRCGWRVGHQPWCERETERRELERLAEHSQEKAAAILESERRWFHHEIMRDVLKEMIRDDGIGIATESKLKVLVERARFAADLAYPPPKVQP